MLSIKIAVISDLHCQSLVSNKKVKKESFLVCGAPRIPENTHPVQSLIKLVKKEELRADVLVCCGDMTHKASPQGLTEAWSLLQEMGREFKAGSIFPTIGNHDVDSRSNKNSDPFETAKTRHPNFPFNDDIKNNAYWGKGFCHKVIAGKADFLIINTAHNHYSKDAAKAGTLEYSTIEAIDNLLSTAAAEPMRLAILHHHPVLHSIANQDSSGVLQLGDRLLDVLVKHQFNLVVHGHRHQPRVTRYKTLHVFAAGSFSAILMEIASRTRNVFHIIDLSVSGGSQSSPTGVIKTWEYGLGKGWSHSSPQSAEFPHLVNIGPTPTLNLANNINEYFERTKATSLEHEDILREFQPMSFLLPDELDVLKETLFSKNKIKIKINEEGSVDSIGKIHLLPKV